MDQALVKTDFHFPGQKSLYVGKVRDVYNIDNKYCNGRVGPYLGLRCGLA